MNQDDAFVQLCDSGNFKLSEDVLECTLCSFKLPRNLQKSVLIRRLTLHCKSNKHSCKTPYQSKGIDPDSQTVTFIYEQPVAQRQISQFFTADQRIHIPTIDNVPEPPVELEDGVVNNGPDNHQSKESQTYIHHNDMDFEVINDMDLDVINTPVSVYPADDHSTSDARS